LIYDTNRKKDSNLVALNTFGGPKTLHQIDPFHPYGPGGLKRKVAPIRTAAPQKDSYQEISRPDDPAELEADRVAAEVTNGGEAELSSRKKEQPVTQTKRAGGGDVTADTLHDIHNLSGGSPLGKAERDFFEPRFNVDFSDVRIHTDKRAAGMAEGINAKAFTAGNNIVFTAGEYQPGTGAGKSLLAHELAHVVQQTGQVQRQENTLEQEHIIRVLTDRLIEDGIDNWHEGAKQGIDNFWKGITDQQIKDLSQTSPLAVLLNIFGNLIWAATAFAPEAWPMIAVFGISTAGIGISSLPGIASMLDNNKKAKSIEIKSIICKYMITFTNDFYQDLVKQTRDGIENYARNNSDVKIDQVVTSPKFKFFKDELYREPGIVDINKVSGFMYSKLMKLWNQAKYFSGVSVADLRETPSWASVLQNDRVSKEAEEKIAGYIPAVLSYQSQHPGEGVLFVITLNQRDSYYDTVGGPSLLIQKNISYVNWYGGSKTREEAIKKYRNTVWIGPGAPEGYYTGTYFHWIPPIGKL
jgi:hypothetical protein